MLSLAGGWVQVRRLEAEAAALARELEGTSRAPDLSDGTSVLTADPSALAREVRAARVGSVMREWKHSLTVKDGWP